VLNFSVSRRSTSRTPRIEADREHFDPNPFQRAIR
jgi:hypothetical protein